jgi:exonuclease SbcC
MDARKGDWAAKKVFSGGTRDQISLALRLSFVLATLPSGKATRPGWLFLDEPLSSFDAARSESLVKLLTAGSLIRPRFSQIFLISHGVAADLSRFDYHLILDGGKISSLSRLPAS